MEKEPFDLGEWMKKNVFNLIFTMLLTGILVLMWSMYGYYKDEPDKWDQNKSSHDRFEELFNQEMQKTNQLRIDVDVLKQTKKDK